MRAGNERLSGNNIVIPVAADESITEGHLVPEFLDRIIRPDQRKCHTGMGNITASTTKCRAEIYGTL